MANQLSTVAGFSVDDATTTGVLTDISAYVNSVTHNGGNALVEDTGLGDARRSEIVDIEPVLTIQINGFLNTTTMGIFGPFSMGWASSVTVSYQINTNQHISGESYVAGVSINNPIGLGTFTAEFRSNAAAGFTYDTTGAS